MNNAGALLKARYAQQIAARTQMLKSPNATSIEGTGNNSTSSIELPAEVDALIDNKAYYPKFRKLMREHKREVLALVEIAATKERPSHWFAKATAKANWDRTLVFLAKLFKVQEIAARVAGKLGGEVTRFIYKQIWSGANVERWADIAKEAGKHRGKYFGWLCRRELQSTT
jgi:hypothetical protein